MCQHIMCCTEGEKKIYCLSLPVLLLLGDVKSSSLGLLLLSTTMNLGCSHLWDYNHLSPRIQSKLEIQGVGSAGNGFLFTAHPWLYPEIKSVAAQKFSMGPLSKLQTKSCPYWNHWKMDYWQQQDLDITEAFLCLLVSLIQLPDFYFFFSSIKQNAAAAQNVTTCPFYCQLRLYWSLSIFAFTTQ